MSLPQKPICVRLRHDYVRKLELLHQQHFAGLPLSAVTRMIISHFLSENAIPKQVAIINAELRKPRFAEDAR